MQIPPKTLTFVEALYKLRACYAARDWTRYKTFEEAWTTCPYQRFDWVEWLVSSMAGNPGWPTKKLIEQTRHELQTQASKGNLPFEQWIDVLRNTYQVPFDYFLPPDPNGFQWDTKPNFEELI